MADASLVPLVMVLYLILCFALAEALRVSFKPRRHRKNKLRIQ